MLIEIVEGQSGYRSAGFVVNLWHKVPKQPTLHIENILVFGILALMLQEASVLPAEFLQHSFVHLGIFVVSR